jgi:hypothetical protein
VGTKPDTLHLMLNYEQDCYQSRRRQRRLHYTNKAEIRISVADRATESDTKAKTTITNQTTIVNYELQNQAVKQ